MEGTAFAVFTLQCNIAVHHFRKILGNCKAQARTLNLSVFPVIHLCKFVGKSFEASSS